MTNLTGEWHGRYLYPNDVDPPVPFIAVLNHHGDQMTGSIVEHVDRGPTVQLTLTSTLMGKVEGANITFLKIYDQDHRNFDTVRYEGVVDEEGVEISGAWIVSANWSGAFMMIRPRPPKLEATRKHSERA